MNDRSNVHRFRHEAMGTVFEIFVACPDYQYAQQASQASFEELDRLEQDLSHYVEHSDVTRINRLSPGQTLRLGPDTFACLKRCRALSLETGGAFDITIGQLLDGWREARRQGRDLTGDELTRLRRCTGMRLLQLDESQNSVKVAGGPVRVDLGGFGKGYGLDRMAEVLEEWNIHAALLHGGRSTALATGAPPGQTGWPVNIRSPFSRLVVRRFTLRGQAISGSGLTEAPHIVDPRSGRLISGYRASWCLTKSAATADGLSTAFMVMNSQEIKRLVANHAGMIAAVVNRGSHEDEEEIEFFGK